MSSKSDFDFVVNYPHFDALWDGLTASGLVRTAATGVKEKLQNDIRGNNPLNCVNRISPRPLLIIGGVNPIRKQELARATQIKSLN